MALPLGGRIRLPPRRPGRPQRLVVLRLPTFHARLVPARALRHCLGRDDDAEEHLRRAGALAADVRATFE